jgi:hypothetical protein
LNGDDKVAKRMIPAARVTPEMTVRWLMSNMDRIQQIAVVFQLTNEHPGVIASDNCSQYMLALSSQVLGREALKKMGEQKSPLKGGPEVKK